MNDIIGKKAKTLIYIETLLKAMMEKYNYSYIKTPILENMELLSFVKDDSLDIGLRPTGTIGVIRNYLENNLDEYVKPIKLWYYGSMFDCDNTETYQFGLDVLGCSNPTIDVEVINLVINLFQLLGLNSFVLKINTNGNKEHFCNVQNYLDYLEIDYIVDDLLVIEPNYYDDIIFEIITSIPDIDEQFIIGSGGRYNNLVKNIGEDDIQGFSFSLDLNNLLKVFDYDGFILHENDGLDVYVSYTDETNIPFALDLVQLLRMNGFNVEFDHLNEISNSNKAKFIITIDEKTTVNKMLTIVNNRTKEKFEIEEDYIINFLDEKVSGENEENLY